MPMTCRRQWIAAGWALALVLALGCARTRDIPRADHMHGPFPRQYLRTQDYAWDTFISWIAREVYEPVGRLSRRLSRDQRLIVHEFAPPIHSREFKSLERERILEWLNIDHDLMCQFIDGTLVYQGEIRDLEHTLLRHGRPSSVIYHQDEGEIERVTFIYKEVYNMERQYFDFANGHLITEDRHR
jgi:hypothetical protein